LHARVLMDNVFVGYLLDLANQTVVRLAGSEGVRFLTTPVPGTGELLGLRADGALLRWQDTPRGEVLRTCSLPDGQLQGCAATERRLGLLSRRQGAWWIHLYARPR
jgi:hypothetical protein